MATEVEPPAAPCADPPLPPGPPPSTAGIVSPPLPPGPPPPSAMAAPAIASLPRPADAARPPNAHCYSECAHAQSILAHERAAQAAAYHYTQPFFACLQPQTTQQAQMFALPAQPAPAQAPAPEAPVNTTLPIVRILYKEAAAWSALLALHGVLTTENSARNDGDPVNANADAPTSCELLFKQSDESTSDATLQRHSACVASLTQLAANCDALALEALKIRSLLKQKLQARANLGAVGDAMRKHFDEVCAMSDAHTRGASMDVTSIAATLRQRSQRLKSELTQARSILHTLNEAKAMRPPQGHEDSTLVIGFRPSDDSGRVDAVAVSDVFAHLRLDSEQGLLDALAALLDKRQPPDAPAPEPAPEPEPEPRRTYLRRSGPRLAR